MGLKENYINYSRHTICGRRLQLHRKMTGGPPASERRIWVEVVVISSKLAILISFWQVTARSNKGGVETNEHKRGFVLSTIKQNMHLWRREEGLAKVGFLVDFFT